MRTIPTAVELLDIVAEYLRTTVADKLPAPDNFYALVAANSLGIVAREIEQGPAADANALVRLQALLGRAGSLEDLDAALMEGLSSGAMPINDPALRDHLLKTTLDEVAIDQPNYATYCRMRNLA